MIALYFEVLPRPGHEMIYLDMAIQLKPELEASGGLLFLDRSRSATRPDWFLSHQFWTDDASMARWRTNKAHHQAQACGRTDVLADYRLRVADVVASVTAGGEVVDAPQPPRIQPPATQPNRFLVSIVSRDAIPKLAGETFTSVYDTSLSIQVVPVVTAREGAAILHQAAGHAGLLHARLCLVSRDYGMFDRAEAPQYFEPVTLA